MKKASMKANVKGLKFEVKMSMDSCEIKNNRHIVGNKDYDEGNRAIKGFNFEINCEADNAEIDLNDLKEEIRESLKTSINNAVKEAK